MAKSFFHVQKATKQIYMIFICNTFICDTRLWDLIQTILFINKKQCFNSFLQENSTGGGGVGVSHYKWRANDIVKITLILKIMLLFPSIIKNFPFPPLCNLLLTFWHSSFYWMLCMPPLIAYFREVVPFPYQRGRDKGMKLWLNNWISKVLIKPSKCCERKPIKHWIIDWNEHNYETNFYYVKDIRVLWILDWPIRKCSFKNYFPKIWESLYPILNERDGKSRASYTSTHGGHSFCNKNVQILELMSENSNHIACLFVSQTAH